ncbi:hypothetical protein [Paraflavitalea pollutisoli]|uniref:hypothetical protein n=1 Tax=Paraflavitalea pollutisoli TaxID=3034143 RepID=UPI0023EBD46D|nr:hypothetical protein [Paraflavitalea sp. H1-2-19X]
MYNVCSCPQVCCRPVQAQVTKQYNHNAHSWLGLFTTFRLGAHGRLVGDGLLRRNDFVSDPVFYFLRAGDGYWFNNAMSLTLAYGQL